MNYNWDWGVFFKSTGIGSETYLDWYIAGLGWTIAIALVGWIIALALGSLLGVMRTVPNRLVSGIATAYVEIFRNVPLLVQLFFWYFGVPALLPEALVSWLNTPHETPLLDWPSFEFLAGAWGLTLYTSAFVAEEFRAGIASVRPEQRAAGLALGLTQRQVWRVVVLPQALRTRR